jgi:hypothetical protein
MVQACTTDTTLPQILRAAHDTVFNRLRLDGSKFLKLTNLLGTALYGFKYASNISFVLFCYCCSTGDDSAVRREGRGEGDQGGLSEMLGPEKESSIP